MERESDLIDDIISFEVMILDSYCSDTLFFSLEQERVQQRTTRPKRLNSVNTENILMQAKHDYVNDLLDLEGYQKRVRSLCYRYIHVLDASEKDNEDYEPGNR